MRIASRWRGQRPRGVSSRRGLPLLALSFLVGCQALPGVSRLTHRTAPGRGVDTEGAAAWAAAEPKPTAASTTVSAKAPAQSPVETAPPRPRMLVVAGTNEIVSGGEQAPASESSRQGEAFRFAKQALDVRPTLPEETELENPEDVVRVSYSAQNARAADEPGRLVPVPASEAFKPTTEGAADEATLAPAAPVEGATAPPGALAEVKNPVPPAAILLQPYGVSADQPGLTDNVSTRIGGSYYEIERGNDVGLTGILEGSKQLWGSGIFAHGGVATEFLDGEWPVSSSIGLSKLATIVDGRVCKPLILSAAYDSYWDNEFFDTGDSVYLDQVRALAGWAISPKVDVGAWGAIGLGNDRATRAIPAGGVGTLRASFHDRVAGYVAANVGSHGSLFISSVGWENPGEFFTELDCFIPLSEAINLFAGVGYSSRGDGAYDAIAGIEIIPGRFLQKVGRHFAKHRDPCLVACGEAVCCPDTCSPRYRGGWANDVYRGALRVVTPSRMRRYLDLEETFTPPAAGGVGEVPPPPVGVGEEPPPPEEECIPRFDFRPKREGRLSQFLDSLGTH